MELSEFAALVSQFDEMADREKVRHFGWYLHTHRNIQEFATGEIRKCFEELRLVAPNVSLHLKRMAEAKPPNLIRSKGKYKLHRREMTELDTLYAAHPANIAVSKLLAELPTKVPDLSERAFLQEAINCYKVKAFRASIVMAWNLAYDHLIRWIFAEPARVSALNGGFTKRFPKGNYNVDIAGATCCNPACERGLRPCAIFPIRSSMTRPRPASGWKRGFGRMGGSARTAARSINRR